MIINKLLSFKKNKPQEENSTSKYRISRRFFLKSFSACSVILISGCQTTPNPGPRIPPYYGNDEFIIPEETIIDWNKLSGSGYASNIPRDWYPESSEREWKAIIIHHSATETGNMAKFHKSHIEEHGWNGIGYDFVIGNGTDSGDGEVEVTYRWRDQEVGAHCKTPGNWANENGIGICLVGNFNNKTPSKNQMNSLVKLTKFLQQRYGISRSNITGHKDTEGANITDCPGRSFPMSEFKYLLNF